MQGKLLPIIPHQKKVNMFVYMLSAHDGQHETNQE
jgi:hypothetical protein